LQTQLINARRIIYFVATDINIIGRNVPILAQQRLFWTRFAETKLIRIKRAGKFKLDRNARHGVT